MKIEREPTGGQNMGKGWLRAVWWKDDGTLPSMKKLGSWVRLVALSVWWWVTGPYWLVRIWREACREEEQNRRAYEADGWKFEELTRRAAARVTSDE